MAIYLHVLPYSCDVVSIFQLYITAYFQVTFNVLQTGMSTIGKEKKVTKSLLFACSLIWNNSIHKKRLLKTLFSCVLHYLSLHLPR